MTEAEQRQKESPLRSDRGSTTIKDTVVSKLAGMAAGEVDGVHMGGGASRSAGGLLGGITGSESTTRGVSVEVGSVETALDLKMGIDYGKNILGTVGEVRQKVTERVHSLTGLNVTELNVTIADVVFPDDSKEADDGGQKESSTRARAIPDFMTRTTSGSESRPDPAERETTPVEPRSRAYTEGSSGPVPEEDVRAEGTPVEEDETRRLRVGDEEPSGGGSSEDRATEEAARAPSSGAPKDETSSDAPHAEAPTDETTLTGGTPSGERAARETASGGDDPDDRTREINREQVAEGEERRSRRRRRREPRDED
jgi:uncharacterized alkaline shock family protein YloU